MNTISSLFNWLGNLVGADPSTLTTTSKTLVGAINEVDGDITTINTHPYITDSGTDGDWKYRKWSDGTAECWGTHSWSISSWTGWGSTYYSTYSGNKSYPSGLFNATPTVTADGHASTGDAWLAGRSGGSSTQTPSYFLMRSSNGTSNITGYLHIHAIGTWQ